LLASLLRVYFPARHSLSLHWRRRGGWIGEHLLEAVPLAPRKRRIEQLAFQTNRRGPHALADAYGDATGTRHPNEVRSASRLGDLYAWLVLQRRPETVVEFGSAFGVSGMYFMTGLQAAGSGHLYSFEINPSWADIAETNIRSLGSALTLTRGSFEDHVDRTVPGPIDLAFVDGIHSYEFVTQQFALLLQRMRPGGLLLFDDINFSRLGARMQEAWQEIAGHPQVVAAVEVQRQLGIVELKS
jgi:predicted O-methyltransferase YrrM